MKLVIIEPLGVEKEKLLAIAGEYVSDRVEIIYYDTKVTDTATLIERGKDADIIVVSNLPMNGEVIRGCDKLKLLSVAFGSIIYYVVIQVILWTCLLYTSRCV